MTNRDNNIGFVIEQARLAGDAGLTKHQLRSILEQQKNQTAPLVNMETMFRAAVEQLENERRENPALLFSYRVLVRTVQQQATSLRTFPSLRSADAFVHKAIAGGADAAAAAAVVASTTIQRLTIPTSSSAAASSVVDSAALVSPVMLRLQSRNFGPVGLVPRAADIAREGGSDAPARRVSKGAYPLMGREQLLKCMGNGGRTSSLTGADAASFSPLYLAASLLTSPTILKLSGGTGAATGSQQMMSMTSQSSGSSFSATSSSFNDKFAIALPDSQNDSQQLLCRDAQGSMGLSTPLAVGLTIGGGNADPQKKARVDEHETGFDPQTTNVLPTRAAVSAEEDDKSKRPLSAAPVPAPASKKPAFIVQPNSTQGQSKISDFFSVKKPAAPATTTVKEDNSVATTASKVEDKKVAPDSASAAVAVVVSVPKKEQTQEILLDDDDEDSSDNIPFSARAPVKQLPQQQQNTNTNGNDDSNDDVPFSVLIKKDAAASASASAPAEKPKPKAPPAKKAATKQMTLNFGPIKKVVSENGGAKNKAAANNSNGDGDYTEDYTPTSFFEAAINDEIIMQDEDDDEADQQQQQQHLQLDKGPRNPIETMMAKARAAAAAANNNSNNSLADINTNKLNNNNTNKDVLKGAASSTPSVTHFFSGAASELSRQFTRKIKEVMEKKPNGEIACRDIIVYVNQATGEEMSKEQYEKKYHALVAKSVAHEAELKQQREAEAAAKRVTAAAAAAKKKAGKGDDDDDVENEDEDAGDAGGDLDEDDAGDAKKGKKKADGKARGKKAAAKGTPTLDNFFTRK